MECAGLKNTEVLHRMLEFTASYYRDYESVPIGGNFEAKTI